MANIKISELNELTKSQTAYDDYIPVVDSSASETKKISVESLTANNVYLLAVVKPNGQVPIPVAGAKYYNESTNKIYYAPDDEHWNEYGTPIEGIFYVVLGEKGNYTYDADNEILVSVGGGGGSQVVVEPDEPTEDTKLLIEEDDLYFQGLEISNTYTTGDNVAYSADYVNRIIESGSNANGNYIKYADGTMICYTSITGTANLSNSWGSLYYAEISTIINFSQEFIAIPNIQITAIPTGSSAFWVGSNATPVITVSSYKNVALIRPTSASNVAYQINLVAIGKWK